MPLVNCPECGHDISDSAVACPSCGRPVNIAPPPVRPVVARTEPRSEGIPPWAFVAMGVVAVLVIFFIFAMMSRDDDAANSNLRVAVNTSAPPARDTMTTDSRSAIPPSDVAPSDALPAPPPEMPTSESTVPGSQTSVNTDRGVVRIEARVISDNGTPQAVRNERFYLLEKDLEQILREARLQPIEGNSLSNSLALAVLDPSRYSDFHRSAMNAINENIEYSGTTDSAGKANMSDVEPGSYYLFGITKTADGFALWSSPVSVRAGENILNLTPQRIQRASGSGAS